MLTSLQKTSLVSTGNEVVVYGTTMGSIGALYPFDNKEDIDFFLHLEMYMRAENLPLSGRDHMMFRSFYGPCKVPIRYRLYIYSLLLMEIYVNNSQT